MARRGNISLSAARPLGQTIRPTLNAPVWPVPGIFPAMVEAEPACRRLPSLCRTVPRSTSAGLEVLEKERTSEKEKGTMGKKKSVFPEEFKEFAMKWQYARPCSRRHRSAVHSRRSSDALTNSVIMPLVLSIFPRGLHFDDWKIRLPQFFGCKSCTKTERSSYNYLVRRLPVRVHNFVILHAFVVFLIVKTVNPCV